MTTQVEIRPFGCSGRFCIFDPQYGWFEDINGAARTYATPGGATRFLRNSGAPWIVKMPSGRTLYINCHSPTDREKFGPHDWSKVNLVTLFAAGGSYDEWRCAICGKTVKRYGICGRPPGDVCKKNPMTG